ncbi:DUF1428 domain-containing protein [Tianweitania populi]|uniref:DUF1428 domain-containing protein n=1 Tax=Tianweitania populi TaxID=1607949 RepID=UPI001676BB9B|nr:DUF1428 domain-containing protein [Tianweitania populi]
MLRPCSCTTREEHCHYVDGFLLAVPKDRLDDYKQIAEAAAGLFMEWGATSYMEAVADDVPYGELTSFPRAVMAKDDEVVIFSYITYPSKAVRDAAQKKMMENERMKPMMEDMPFDGKRMIFGGFKAIVER